MTNYINQLLEGKGSNAIAMFFCGEYFCKSVTSHQKFPELQQLFWNVETRLHNKFSRKGKNKKALILNIRVSGFFTNPNLENNERLLTLQKEILGSWGKVDDYFGVSIDWKEVFRSAYKSNQVNLTNSDFDKVVSLTDIPMY